MGSEILADQGNLSPAPQSRRIPTTSKGGGPKAGPYWGAAKVRRVSEFLLRQRDDWNARRDLESRRHWNCAADVARHVPMEVVGGAVEMIGTSGCSDRGLGGHRSCLL